MDSTYRRAFQYQTSARQSKTHIIAPGALIPGTWAAGQIPAERLVAPFVVLDLNGSASQQISLDDIASWESRNGMIPQGAVLAVRRAGTPDSAKADSSAPFPIARDQTCGWRIERMRRPVNLRRERRDPC